jgi:hypothetical protein
MSALSHTQKPKSLSAVAEMASTCHEMYPSYIKEFLDSLRAAPDGAAGDMIQDEPQLFNPVFDAHIAGLAEYIAFVRKTKTPQWAELPSRFLVNPVFFGGRHSRDLVIATTTFSMRRRNLFCGEVDL